MANTIPCPNPVCSHQFTSAELQSAAQLACPKCGFRMQGKGPALVSKPPPAGAKAAPIAVPIVVPAIPKAAPPVSAAPPASAKPPVVSAAPPVVSAAPPMAVPLPAPPLAPAKAPDEFFNPAVGAEAGALVRPATPIRRGFDWVRALILLFVLGFAGTLVIVAIGVVFVFYGFGTHKGWSPKEIVSGNLYYGQIRSAKDGNEKVYKLALAKDEWAVDRDVQSGLEAHAAWRHKEAEGWFAIVVQDFGMYKPRDSEMLRIALDRLEGYYGDALELGKKAEPAKVRDLAAQKIQFKGQIKSANWLGECYMFFNNGVGYWLFVASPDPVTVERFADEVPQKHFFVESERRGWREQPPPMETFASANARLTLTVPKGVWEKAPNAKDIDDSGVLAMTGRYQKEKDNRKNASLLIFTLDKKEDLKAAMKAGREYLENKAKNDNEMYKVVLAAEVSPGQGDIGTQEAIGNRQGRIVDLKRQFNEETQRYILLAVVNESDSMCAIMADCTWESRQIWRQDFLDVLRSVKFKQGE